MAASNLNLGKASGGVLNVQPADGTTTTSLVLPAINGTVVAADSNGNVGIGTSSPSSKLTVLNDSINIESSNTSAERSYIWLGKYSGSSSNNYGTHIGCYHNYGVSAASSLIISPSNVDVLSVDSGGNTLHLSPLGGLGYGAGAGGTVTQLTSKSTTVTLNTPSGRITMNNGALAANTQIEFIVNNSLYGTADTVVPNVLTYGGNYSVEVRGNTTGQFVIRVKNISGASLSEAVVIGYNIIKGATS